jgi:histidinol-phosphate aminotransferase
MKPTASIEAVMQLARPEIRSLQPYAHAVWDPALVRLHANELPWTSTADLVVDDLNRYPEPQPAELIAALARYYTVANEQVLATRGGDEAIDLVTRAFCPAGASSVIVTPPTFGMYAVAAAIQGARVLAVPLSARYQLAIDAVSDAIETDTRIVWLCSPNNPTGNLLDPRAVDAVLQAATGRALVVIDEAYAEFATEASATTLLANNPHLVVLKTLSKAHGLAGARVGALLAHSDIVRLLRRIIPPYALARPSIVAALAALQPAALALTAVRVNRLITARAAIAAQLADCAAITRVFPSDSNFLLVRCRDAQRVFAALQRAGLLVRDFSASAATANCLRMTIGNDEHNALLLKTVKELS